MLGLQLIILKRQSDKKNDYLSMYNLAHTYIYEEGIIQNIDKPINLLIKSSNHFVYSVILLSIFLIRNFGFDEEAIIKEITKRTEKTSNLISKILNIIKTIQLSGKSSFESLYELYRQKIFLYDIEAEPIQFTDISKIEFKNNATKYPKAKNISKLFYEGFGYNS